MIEGSDRPVPIYKLVSSHLGRKSYIKRMVQLKVPYERIKQQTGHHSTRVFESYFSYDKEMVEGVNDSIFSDDITITKSKDTTPKEILSISEMDKNLDQYKTWFDEGKIDEEEYKKLRKSPQSFIKKSNFFHFFSSKSVRFLNFSIFIYVTVSLSKGRDDHPRGTKVS